ncbi:MAG: hypothetical protein AMXMBFR82_04410 [Candidatus Hydrogenedentota bacterium]
MGRAVARSSENESELRVETFPELSQMPETTINGVVAIAIAVGTLYCFLGYKTLKVVIGLTGFILAGGVAGLLIVWLFPEQTAVAAIAGLVGGVCGAMALFFLYKFGVFLVGFLGSALVTYTVMADSTNPYAIWIVFGCALAGGLIAIALERGIMVLATAALGAWIVVCGIAFFLVGPSFLDILQQPVELGKDRQVLITCWALVAISGAVAQFATTRKRPREVVVTRA